MSKIEGTMLRWSTGYHLQCDGCWRVIDEDEVRLTGIYCPCRAAAGVVRDLCRECVEKAYKEMPPAERGPEPGVGAWGP